ncbi:MAG: hypothetical protein ACREA0_32115, partial [bacterium]
PSHGIISAWPSSTPIPSAGPALGGCDPKKVLVGAAEALDRLDRLEDRGVRRDGPRIEWRDLMRFKRTFTETTPRARNEGFAKAGIAAYHGRASFFGALTTGIGIRRCTRPL